MPETAARPSRPQHVFVVARTEQLSPHLVRVHLGGPAFDAFIEGAAPERLAATDRYVKLLVARPELGLTPPYDLDALKADRPKSERPVRRTYTVRSVDRGTRTIAIDFVVHGDEGVAGPWAAAARPGDLLALSGPGGTYRPADDAGTAHVFIADDSAIPAVASALEAMDVGARGIAVIEVDGSADELPLVHPDGVEVRWVHRSTGSGPSAQPGALLTEVVRGLDRPSLPVQVFAHGERTAMKAIRQILQEEWGIDKQAMSLSAYWALGREEDRFQAEKREPVGMIFSD